MAKTKRRAVAHNALPTFLGKFTHPFTIEEAFIDCKEMSKNYTHGLIPLTDIADGVDATIGPWQGRINQYFGLINLTPYYADVDVKHVYSHPAFNTMSPYLAGILSPSETIANWSNQSRSSLAQ